MTPEQFNQVVEQLKSGADSLYNYPQGAAQIRNGYSGEKDLIVNTNNANWSIANNTVDLPVSQWNSQIEGSKYNQAYCAKQAADLAQTDTRSAEAAERARKANEALDQVKSSWRYSQIAERLLSNPELTKCGEQKEHNEQRGREARLSPG